MFIAIGTIIILIVIYGILTFNKLVSARNRVDTAWSGVDAQLKRRHDHIPGLVQAVKEYSQDEKGIFKTLAKTHNEGLGGRNLKEVADSENTLTRQIKVLFAVAESYPELKDDQNFLNLQTSLASAEDKIQSTRRHYNTTVRDYNTLLKSFPVNIMADLLSYHNEELFEIELDAVGNNSSTPP